MDEWRGRGVSAGQRERQEVWSAARWGRPRSQQWGRLRGVGGKASAVGTRGCCAIGNACDAGAIAGEVFLTKMKECIGFTQ